MSKSTIAQLIKEYQPTGSEFSTDQVYPKRIVWHVESVLRGMYGMALADIDALPKQDQAEVERLRETYRLLVNYYKEGIEDPERERIHLGLGRDLMSYLREQGIELLRSQGKRWVQERAERQLENYKTSNELTLGALLKELSEQQVGSRYYYEQLELCFNWILSNYLISAEEKSLLSNFFAEDRQNAILTLIGALFVSCMESFDRRKLDLLHGVLKQEDAWRLRAYALPALLILGRRHQEELLIHHADFVTEVEDVLQCNIDKEEVYLAIKTIFLTYHTANVVEQYREKILPEMLGLSQKLQDLMGGALPHLSQMSEEMLKGDPDRIADMSEIERLMAQKQREFELMTDNEMDLHFLMVKDMQRSDFFSKMFNWFTPYDETREELTRNAVELLKEVAPMMTRSFPIISSDRYAFVTFPMVQALGQNLKGQLDGMPLPKDVLPRKIDFEVIARDFVFGLYRFYHLSDHAVDLTNPFANEAYIPDGAFLQKAELLSPELLERWGGQLIRHQKIRLVRHTYERLVAQYHVINGDTLRALGGVALSEKDSAKAIDYLKGAIEIEGATTITTKMVAEELLNMHRYEEATDFLGTYEPQLEGNAALPLTTMRLTLAEQASDFDLALALAYKVDFLNECERSDDTANLARLLLKQGAVDRSISLLEDRFDRFREKKEQGVLSWYLGLSYLAKGDRQRGIGCFSKMALDHSTQIVFYKELIESTTPLLISCGYEAWEIGLIKDIAYDLFK